MIAILGGSALLAGLAVMIGLATDRQARDAAWSRIATARRLDAERRVDLEEKELALEVQYDELATWERRLELRESRLLHREDMLVDQERELGRGA